MLAHFPFFYVLLFFIILVSLVLALVNNDVIVAVN